MNKTDGQPKPMPRTKTPGPPASPPGEPDSRHLEAKRCVKKAVEAYKSSLLLVDRSQRVSKEVFKKHHEKALERARKELTDALDGEDASFLSPYVDRLNQKANVLYETQVELLKSEMEVNKLLVEAKISAATREYTERMGEHFKSKPFMPEVEFRSESKAIIASAVLSASAGLGEAGLDSLHEALESLHLQYEERNRLNSPTEQVAIGIDLGTTYCCVAVYLNGRVQIIPCRLGCTTVPSYVAFMEEEEVVGEAAKAQAHENPRDTIFDAKRLIGRDFKDPCVQADIKLWPFDVVQIEETGKPAVMCRGLRKDPEAISAKVLKHLKGMAENYLQVKRIEKAVITVPAYFNDGQRQATKDAGYIAGLDVLQIVNEPTAAAMAYYFERPPTGCEVRNILVYDLGGGTFDVSVLELRAGGIEVKAVMGDMHLGGEDFDEAMVNFCAAKFREKTAVNLLHRGRGEMSAGARAIRRLRNECERQKKFLSTANHVTIALDGVCGTDLNVRMGRADFETMNQAKFQRTIDIVREALREAKLRPDEIHEIVLVGGSTRIPMIQKMLAEVFGKRPLYMVMNPEEAVARGAAILAAKLNKEVKQIGEEEKGVTLSEVTPLPIGILVKGGGMSVIVPRNESVPCTKTKPYYTSEHDQTAALVSVYEGEDPEASNNHLLGSFSLTGIPAAAQGVESMKVMVQVTKEGIIHVAATVDSNGVSSEILIEGDRGRLTSEAKESLREKENRGRS